MITVRQPWAWAIIHGHKDVENRSWPTRHRGLLLIHAGQRLDPDGFAFLERQSITVPASARERGVIVGSVHVTNCIRDASSVWAEPECWHWLLAEPGPASRAVPCRGRMGLYRAPENWEEAFSSGQMV